jgi:release factor glutamine methyltransferase
LERNNVKTLLETATARLTTAGCDTPRLDAEVLLAHVLGQDRTWLFMVPHHLLTGEQQHRFEELLSRREQREPVAYLIGHKEFFGLDFLVDRRVLIPRPETELLVETALRIYDLRPVPARVFTIYDSKPSIQIPKPKIQNRKSKIVDVGAGSGCIAIALAKYLPQASLLAIDASAEALQLARQNASRHNVAERITFLQGSLLEPLAQPVDLIVSNPPYVSCAELGSAAVSPEVKLHEPGLALAGGEDGLDVIRQLLLQARHKLNPGGSLLVEIGAGQGAIVSQLARQNFPNAQIELKKDLAGLDRLLALKVL